MSLGRRLALVLGGLVAVVVVVSAVLSAVLARASLEGSVDDLLESQADGLAGRVAEAIISTGVLTPPPAATQASPLNASATRLQILTDELDVVFESAPIPIDEAVIAGAAAGGDVFHTADLDGTPFRVLTRTLPDGSVTQYATTVESLEDGLGDLQQGLVIVGLTGVALAGLIGWAIARRFTRPIVDVTEAASRLVHDQLLPNRIETDRTDEVGQLAGTFNELVDALRLSREQQDRLVADASHELRTPLTSLRMKIDFLAAESDMPAAQRESVVAGAAVELESLTALVAELVELASSGAVDEASQLLALGDLVQDVAARTRLTTHRTITVTTDSTQIEARPAMVRRAISNLVDNAHKYSPVDAEVEVRQVAGCIEVRDHGPGMSEVVRGRAFDRFYRAPDAQTSPGSGIGLAIVKQVADLHDGEVWIHDADGGGSVVGFSVGPRP